MTSSPVSGNSSGWQAWFCSRRQRGVGRAVGGDVERREHAVAAVVADDDAARLVDDRAGWRRCPFGSPQISVSVTAPVARSTRTRCSGAGEMPWPRNVPRSARCPRRCRGTTPRRARAPRPSRRSARRSCGTAGELVVEREPRAVPAHAEQRRRADDVDVVAVGREPRDRRLGDRARAPRSRARRVRARAARPVAACASVGS